MPARSIRLRTKVLTLVPLALASGAWTFMLVAGAVAESTTAAPKPPPLVIASVPAAPIETPATPTIAGEVAPALARAAADVNLNANAGGIPSLALSAYKKAEAILGHSAPSCHLPWSLVAAIGKVESDHGRFGGNALDVHGTATPGIFGIPLDGTNGTEAIPATDPTLDGGGQWERAVGPMQFLPGTWHAVAIDANRDGQADPQNIFDSAAAAGIYLCSGHADLSTPDGVSAAVMRYNHSQDYVNLVMALAQQYAAGNFTAVPNASPSPSPSPTPPPAQAAAAPAPAPSSSAAAKPTASASPSKSSSPSPSSSPSSSSNLNTTLGGTTCQPALGGLLSGPPPPSCTASP